MKFCPKCGTTLVGKMDGGRERQACPICPFICYGEFSIGVGGVVIRDGKALLIRRGQEPRRGAWQIPGGYVEHDELMDVAVVREVFEESGVRSRVVDVLGVRHMLGEPSANVYVVFRLAPIEGEPVADGEEITGAGYFSTEEIETMPEVQSLSKWCIAIALSGQTGFLERGQSDLPRQGYVMFGLNSQP